jgi:hypothetical protein
VYLFGLAAGVELSAKGVRSSGRDTIRRLVFGSAVMEAGKDYQLRAGRCLGQERCAVRKKVGALIVEQNEHLRVEMLVGVCDRVQCGIRCSAGNVPIASMSSRSCGAARRLARRISSFNANVGILSSLRSA